MILAEDFLDYFVVWVRVAVIKIAPAASGGIMRIVDIGIGKGCLQVFDDFPGRLFVDIATGEDPEPFQGGHFLQNGQVINFVEAEIQIHQVGQVPEGGEIPDLVLEKFGIFQIFQAGEGRNIGNVIACHDEHPKIGEGSEPVQPVYFVMADI